MPDLTLPSPYPFADGDALTSSGLNTILLNEASPTSALNIVNGYLDKDNFDAAYADLAADYGALLHPDFLRALTAEADLATALQRYMQPDGIHPNAEGVARIVADIGPSVLELLGRAD